MNNDNQDDVFSRSITAAFMMASFQQEQDDLRYTPPARSYNKDMPAFLREQLDGTKSRDPWGNGWHNGFPPGAGA